eukprot:426334-Rhodomonas_salina.1
MITANLKAAGALRAAGGHGYRLPGVPVPVVTVSHGDEGDQGRGGRAPERVPAASEGTNLGSTNTSNSNTMIGGRAKCSRGTFAQKEQVGIPAR